MNKLDQYKWDPFKYSSENYSSMIAGTACIGTDSKYERWIQTQGFQKWSKNNCGYLFTSTFLTECSIIKTNGIEEGIDHDNETLQINESSNNIFFYLVEGSPRLKYRATLFPLSLSF